MSSHVKIRKYFSTIGVKMSTFTKKTIAKFLLCLALLFFYPLLAQDTTEASEAEAQDENEVAADQPTDDSETAPATLGDALELIDEFNAYIDSTPLSFAQNDFEEKLFDSMKRAVNVTTNYLNTLQLSMNSVRRQYDLNLDLRGLEFYQPILQDRSYYSLINSKLGFNFFLLKSMNFLEKINQSYDNEYELINASLGFDNIRSTIYRLKYLLAMVYYYQGSYRSLKKSVKVFEDVLGENENNFDYTSTDKDRGSVYSYLASGFDLLISDAGTTGPREMLIYKRNKLYYLWQLVTIYNQDNETLRDLKLRRLVGDYYPIMDKNGVRYREVYAPFMIKNNIAVD